MVEIYSLIFSTSNLEGHEDFEFLLTVSAKYTLVVRAWSIRRLTSPSDRAAVMEPASAMFSNVPRSLGRLLVIQQIQIWKIGVGGLQWKRVGDKQGTGNSTVNRTV